MLLLLLLSYGPVFESLSLPTDPPVPVVEIAFATKPTEAPSWTDVSEYVEAFSFRRGKQGPLESVGVGTGTLTLDNRDRRFDPTYTSGPYYGNLKSTRRVRIRAEWNGSTYDLFYGYVDAWPLRRENYGNQYVEVTLSDAFKVFALSKVSASRPEERTDERIAALLTAINWTTGQGWVLGDATFGILGSTTYLAPVGDRALDQGTTTVQAATLDRAQALTHMQAVERTEFGQVFIGKSGAVVFHNRTRRLLAGSTGSLATFGDDLSGGELPYAGVQLDYDDAEIWNDITVTREGGTAQAASDADSMEDHFPRSLDWSTLGTSDGESLILAGYLKNHYAQQRLRVRSLVLDPETGDGSVWHVFLNAELGEVYTVRNTPLGGGNRIEQVSFLEGIAVDWSAAGNSWGRPVWSLSPADTTPYFILGQSVLGTNTYLGI